MDDSSRIFMKDTNLDAALKDIIDIFTNVKGVELVRLSGLTKRFARLSQNSNVSQITVHNIVEKLKLNGIINYRYTMHCPHCNEITYQIIERDINTPKLCDTCHALYNLIEGYTLNVKEEN